MAEQNLTIKEKLEIVRRIEKHILEENNGYCGIIWASKEVMGYDFFPKKYTVNSVAYLATKSGRFIKEKVVGVKYFDYYISINPDSNWFKRNPIKTEIIRFVITVVSALIIFKFTKNL